MRRTLVLALALLASAEAGAASIFKCVDAAGKVTFTQGQNCPAGNSLDNVVNAHNAAPSGSSAPVQMATPAAPARPEHREKGGQNVLVVGGTDKESAPLPKPEAAPDAGRPPAAAPSNQPCTRLVDQPYSYTLPGKNGGTRSVAGIRKVAVPC